MNSLDSKQVKKYIDRPIPWLIKKATEVFNAYIRERDRDLPCISCKIHRPLEAGHFYSGGHYPELRFNENNVHGQCKHCNCFLSGNLNEYRKNIVDRIGQDGLDKLDFIVAATKKTGYRWDKFALIEIILKYKKQ